MPCSFQDGFSSSLQTDRRKEIENLLTKLKTIIGSVKDVRDKALSGDIDILFSEYAKLIENLPRSYALVGGASVEETSELKTKVMRCIDTNLASFAT